MFEMFRKSKWSLDSLTPPGGEQESIYDYVLRSPKSDSLPDEPILRKKYKFGWVGGAMDGVFGGRSQAGESTKKAFELVEAVRRLLKEANQNTLENLYESVARDSILPFIDEFLRELNKSRPAPETQRLLETGRYFAARAVHREAVKFGLALIGIAGTPEDLVVLRTLGKNDEFTLYSAVAIARVAKDAEQALWDLAKDVRGWGRIQIVERLKETHNSEIQAWMLRDGFRNEIMDEYLACVCARAGQLHVALNQQFVDEALLEGAADILRALVAEGGPAEGMEEYDHGADACESYINIVWGRNDLKLKHLLSVAALRRFLSSPEGWDKRAGLGWSESRRRVMLALCDHVCGRDNWRDKVLEALSSADESIFYDGDTAAKELSMDTWEVHFKRVRATPLTSSSWYRLMQQTDEARIGAVLEFAEATLPLEQVATGPRDELGLGPGFEVHETLDWIVQDLRRFPLRGWIFISAGLCSPLVRNRNMSIRALAVWPRESWTPQVTSAVLEARDLEPCADVKQQINNLLEGKPID